MLKRSSVRFCTAKNNGGAAEYLAGHLRIERKGAAQRKQILVVVELVAEEAGLHRRSPLFANIAGLNAEGFCGHLRKPIANQRRKARRSRIIENDTVDEKIRRGELKARGDLHLAGKFKTASLCFSQIFLLAGDERGSDAQGYVCDGIVDIATRRNCREASGDSANIWR